jgi:hypothetical protein
MQRRPIGTGTPDELKKEIEGDRRTQLSKESVLPEAEVVHESGPRPGIREAAARCWIACE